MTHLIDPAHFRELARQHPEDVCRRALCRYDDVKKSYILPVWGDEYEISPHESEIGRISRNFRKPHEYLYVFIINYLLKAKQMDPFREWISEKDMPGGATFFRGPHDIPTHLITSRYTGDMETFKRACEDFGGTALNMADAACVFQITPRIPVAVLFWDGDNEFGSESRLLFDRSIYAHLTLDIIFALAVAVCARIGKIAG